MVTVDMRSHDYFKSFKGFCRFQTYLMYLLRSCSAIWLEGLHILFEEHSLCFIETMLCRQKFIESGFWNTILRILGNPSTTVICLFNAERVTNSVKFIFALSDFDLIKSYSFSRNLNATSLFLVIVLVVILSLCKIRGLGIPRQAFVYRLPYCGGRIYKQYACLSQRDSILLLLFCISSFHRYIKTSA